MCIVFVELSHASRDTIWTSFIQEVLYVIHHISVNVVETDGIFTHPLYPLKKKINIRLADDNPYSTKRDFSYLNPLTAVVAYIRVFIFSSTLSTTF